MHKNIHINNIYKNLHDRIENFDSIEQDEVKSFIDDKLNTRIGNLNALAELSNEFYNSENLVFPSNKVTFKDVEITGSLIQGKNTNLDVDIKGLTDRIAVLEETTTKNTTNIASNTYNIASNTSIIGTHDSQITNNSANITNNTKNITTNTNNITSNTAVS